MPRGSLPWLPSAVECSLDSQAHSRPPEARVGKGIWLIENSQGHSAGYQALRAYCWLWRREWML